MKITSIIKITLCGVLLINSQAFSSGYFETESEEGAYQQGISLRNQKQYAEAKEYFLPLAEKGYAKAQHNFAYCAYEEGKEIEAYHWYKLSSQQGLQASKNNLKRMNLLYLLLPNDMLAHIASFLSMREFPSFKQLSQRSYQLAWGPILKNGYKVDEIFRAVTFDPYPDSIEIFPMISVTNSENTGLSPVEVHFRNPRHLRRIAKKFPFIKAKKIIFVEDGNVSDGSELEFGSENAIIFQDYYIHVRSDQPVEISGKLDFLPCLLMIPKGSKWKINLNSTLGQTFIQLIAPESYMKSNQLADILENGFDENLYEEDTKNAEELLTRRILERTSHPEKFPDLYDLTYPILYGSEQPVILQKDYISSEHPIVYIANNFEVIDTLHNKYPVFASHYIDYVNYNIQKIGIYSCDSITIEKSFEISSSGDLLVSGLLELPNYYIRLSSEGNLWLISANIKGVSAVLHSKYGEEIRGINDGKPDNLPMETWLDLLRRLGVSYN